MKCSLETALLRNASAISTCLSPALHREDPEHADERVVMHNITRLLLLALLCGGLLGCSSFHDDLDSLCVVAAEVNADPSIAASARLRESLSRWQPESTDGQNAKDGVAYADPSTVYELLVQAAPSEGDVWSCAPLASAAEAAVDRTPGE